MSMLSRAIRWARPGNPPSAGKTRSGRRRSGGSSLNLRLESLEVRLAPAVFGQALDLGGAAIDEGWSVALDSVGNVYVAGSFRGTADFDPGSGTTLLTSASPLNSDAFVAKYTPEGALAWAHSFGASVHDDAFGIAVDADGDVYTTGRFVGAIDFDPGPGTTILTNSNTFYDMFVLKLDTDGRFVWARQVHSVGDDVGSAVAVDASGRATITGYFSYTADFDPGPGVFNLTPKFGSDVFVLQLDADGWFEWARHFAGGGTQDFGEAVAVDALGNVYTTGRFQGTADFDPGLPTANLTSEGYWDVFVCKLDRDGQFAWARRFGGPDNDVGYGIGVDAGGNVFTAGYFRYEVDFDPGPGSFLLSDDFDEAFVSKLDRDGEFVWARQLGGGNHDRAYALTLDAVGNVYTGGYYSGAADFDPGPNVFELTAPGNYSAFVSKLNNDGEFVEAVQLKPTAGAAPPSSTVHEIAIHRNGTVATTGLFNGKVDFDPGPGTQFLTSAGQSDVFVSLLRFGAPPTGLTLSSSIIAENEPSGTVVGTLSAIDPDLGDHHDYTLVAGAGDSDNARYTIDGATLKSAEVFDFEAGSSHGVRIRVTDSLGGWFERTFSITVTDVAETISTPVLTPIGDRTGNEGATLTFTATATVDGAPASGLRFTLLGEVAGGASINPITGVFTWTPTEIQGPGRFPVTIRASVENQPSLFDEETITVTVNEVNQAPELQTVGSRSGMAGLPINFKVQATDADLPANGLTFSLGTGAPLGASIDPVTGQFSFTPTRTGVFSTRIIVNDNGSPSLSDFEDVSISVTANTIPFVVQSVVINDGQPGRSEITSLTVSFSGLAKFRSNPFTLTGPRRTPRLPVPIVSVINDRTVVRFNFPGSGPGSLPNGNFTLRINGDRVTDALGRKLDGDRNGRAGGNYVFRFSRQSIPRPSVPRV